MITLPLIKFVHGEYSISFSRIENLERELPTEWAKRVMQGEPDTTAFWQRG